MSDHAVLIKEMDIYETGTVKDIICLHRKHMPQRYGSGYAQ